MDIAKKPANEKERLAALKELNILDTPVQASFDKITRLAKTMFKVPIVAIALLDDERQWFKSIQGLDVCQTDRDVAFCAHAILQDGIFIVKDATKDPRFADNPLVTQPPKIRFYAGCPIRSPKGYKVGDLCLVDQKPRDLTEKELAPLKDIAALVEEELAHRKQAVAQKELITALDEAERVKLIDPLTRIWNRAGMDGLLYKQITMARTSHKGFGIAMIDIDDFKKINDTYGHLAGDEVLRNVTSRIVSGFRDTDVVGRWGGEEFLVVINIDKLESLLPRVEQTRLKVSKNAILYEKNTLNITITIGATFYNGESAIKLEELISQADKALYEGKNSGKNKTVVFHDKESRVTCHSNG